jgi:hypothetical protein
MTNTLGMALIGMAIMGVAIWGPTIYMYRKKRRGGEAVMPVHLAIAMALELAGFLAFGLTMQLVGVAAGEYLLIVALVIGGAGAHVLSSITFVPRG